MTNGSGIDPQSWKHPKALTEGTLTWRGWGAVALYLFVATIGVFAALLHVVGVI